MQIDWVNILANVTMWSIVTSAVIGVGSFVTSRVMEARERVKK